MGYDAEQMRMMAAQGQAMRAPMQDRPGRFPIANRADLENAIRAVGRVQPPTEEARAMVRRHIIKRAEALGLSALIPAAWNQDGSLSSS